MEFKMNPDGSMTPIDGGAAAPTDAAQLHVEPGAAPPAPPPTMPTPMPSGGAGGALVKESSAADFMHDVIEASMQVPVIVDFWAPWCEPCKQLGPALEKAVARAGGLVRMVKINMDENRELATQLRVQSIPTVFAFKDGRPVDGFAGALPDSQIKSFIERLLDGAKPPLEQALDSARELLDAGDAADALALYRQIQAEAPDSDTAIAGVIRAMLATGDQAGVEDIIAALPAELKAKSEIAAALSAVELGQAAVEVGDIAPLRDAVAANPADPGARLDLAMGLFAAAQHEAAVDEFLELIRLNRSWNDDAGRVQLLKVFDALGPTHELTIAGRKRLSSVLFS